MKLTRLTLIIVFLFSFLGIGQEFKAMSYNIKYDNKKDTVNNWNDRKTEMLGLLKKHNPEFIGMQEVLYHQLEYLNAYLSNYKYIGVGRDDGKQKGEYSPIFYNTAKYELLESNTFWLSKTPNKISVGWDAAMERICSYALFQHKISKEKFWIFNTHFDHIGVKARKKSVKLILKKINQLNNEKLPVVLMGDFNLTPEEKPIQVLQNKMDDYLHIAQRQKNDPKGTFNGFDVNDPMEKRIDYIFTKGFRVRSYEHINERMANGKHISDHLPVLAYLTTE